MSVDILILRVVVGLTMAAHGAQKMFGWFEGPGFAGMSGMIQKIGFRSAKLFAALVAVAEVGGSWTLLNRRATRMDTPWCSVGVNQLDSWGTGGEHSAGIQEATGKHHPLSGEEGPRRDATEQTDVAA